MILVARCMVDLYHFIRQNSANLREHSQCIPLFDIMITPFTDSVLLEFIIERYINNSGSGLYSGGLTWSIVLRCDDHTGIFTCDGCARDPYFYAPAETQSYVIKLSCSRKVLAASGD